MLAVTTPHMCGMGGDLFALVHDGIGPPTALNASGRAGRGADAARLRAEGATTMPFRHDIRSVPVPGCVDGWLALHERYGKLDLAQVLEPARARRGGWLRGRARCSRPCSRSSVTSPAPTPSSGPHPGDPAERCRRPGVARALAADRL